MDKHLGNKEVAEMLGIRQKELYIFRKRYPGLIPEPVDEIAASPIWHRSQIWPIAKKLKKGGIKELREIIYLSKKDATRKSSAKKRKEVLKEAKDEILDVRVIHEKE